MTDERLVDELVTRAFGWRPAPDRYLKPHRGWVTRSRFRPIQDVGDALRLLDALTSDYSLVNLPGRAFTAQVRLAGRTGKASGEPKGLSICVALGRALGLSEDFPE
jgi:hypothetical protein